MGSVEPTRRSHGGGPAPCPWPERMYPGLAPARNHPDSQPIFNIGQRSVKTAARSPDGSPSAQIRGRSPSFRRQSN
jgi:hypothetical protein